MQSLTKDMICRKFTGKDQDATVWLRSFDKECERLNIPENHRVEALHLFLDGPPATWFESNWLIIGISTWEQWTAAFLESFAGKSWSDVSFAVRYRWMKTGSYEIDKLELDEDSLLLNIEVQIMNKDGSETYAYIADSMGTRMLVYDYAKDDLHVYQHPFFFPDPAYGFYHVNGKEFTVMDGLFNIVLDERTDTLFFHTLSSGRECSAPAGLLRNKTMSEEQARKFTRSPERPFHVSNEVITDNGLMIFPSLEHNSLFVWDTRTPYTMDNFMLVAKDDEALQFPTGMKIAGKTFIMMTARLQNMLVTGVPNRGEINYRILMGDVDHLKSMYSRYSSRVSGQHVGGKHSGAKHGPATSFAYSRTSFYKKFPPSHFPSEFEL